MRRLSPGFLFLLMLTSLLAIAGCGGGEETDTAPAEPPPAEEEQPTPGPILIVRPYPGPDPAPWIVEEDGERNATFGDSMRVSQDFSGFSINYGTHADIKDEEAEDGEFSKLVVKIQPDTGDPYDIVITVRRVAGQPDDIEWSINGNVMTECSNCDDLPAEAEGEVLKISADVGTLSNAESNSAQWGKDPGS